MFTSSRSRASRRALVILLLTGLAVRPAANTAPGTLDPSFSGDGTLVHNLGAADVASAVVVQPDGRIVSAGTTQGAATNFALTRRLANGFADNSFDANGQLAVDFGGVDRAAAVAIQPDGRIVVAGYSDGAGTYDFAIARLDTAGQLDPSFGGDGRVTVDFSNSDDRATAIAIQDDGKIVVGGTTLLGQNFAIARLNGDGTLDTTFSGDGRLATTFGGDDRANALDIDGSGRIVLVGSSKSGTNTRVAILRLLSDGTADTAFDADGELLLDFVDGAGAADDDEDVATAVRIQPDGKIVVAIHGGTADGRSDIIVVRLLGNGTYDPAFNDLPPAMVTPLNGDGRITFGFGATDRPSGLVLLHNGKIAIAGSAVDDTPLGDVVFAMLRADGTLDPAFGTGGLFLTGLGGDDRGNALALAPDGTLIAAGSTDSGGTLDFALVAVGADVPADLSFDSDGRRLTELSSGADIARAVVIRPNGRIVVAGERNPAPRTFAVIQHSPSGALDDDFSADGIVEIEFGTSAAAYGMALQPDGRVVVVGSGALDADGTPSGYANGAVARLLPDGSLDPSFYDVLGPAGTVRRGRRVVDAGSAVSFNDVALLPDGRMALVGSVEAGFQDLLVVLLRADGSLDTSFSGDGIWRLDLGAFDIGQAVAIQPDGKIVVAGYTTVNGGQQDFLVARLLPNGTLDSSFDADGWQTVSFGVDDRAQSLVLQPDGRIVVAGWWQGPGEFAITRLLPNGALDVTFAVAGRRNVTFGAGSIGGFDYANDMAALPDGRLIVAGWSDAGAGPSDVAVLRMTADGAIDTTFANQGKLLLDFGATDQANAVAVDPATGKVVLVGRSQGGPDAFLVARLGPDAGAPPPVLPSLTIDDVAVHEGTGGAAKLATFTVTLSAVPVVPVSMMVVPGASVVAVAGSAAAVSGAIEEAQAPGDFDATPQAVSFLPGSTTLTRTVSVPIVGDGVDERNETFMVGLTSLSGATTADGYGVGTILDDEVGLAIQTPTSDPVFAATTFFLEVGGLVNDVTGIQSVAWTTAGGASGTASGTTAWSAQVPLVVGPNVITVTATDVNGNTASDTLTATLSTVSYSLAEGATGPFFDYDLVIANPNDTPAPIEVAFLRSDGVTVPLARVLAPTSRSTIRVDDVPGLESTAVSAVVTSMAAVPLVVERSMYWDDTAYGGHAGSSVPQAGTTWLFAEGAQGFFDTYVLLANAGAAPANVTVRFLLEFEPPVARNYVVAPTSRFNVYAGDIPELAGKAFSIAVSADRPIIAERAMYFGAPLFNGGHGSAGAQVPATTWFLAEGATGTFFDTYVLIGNPNAAGVMLTVTFLRADGTTVVKQYELEGNRRLTLNVEDQDPQLLDTAVSTVVTASLPVIVERAMYWPGPFTQWHEAHNSFGVTETGTRWGLAEGRSGGARAFQTYILLANPSPSTAAQVDVTFLRNDGTTLVRQYVVPPSSRFNVDVSTFVPELANQEYGAIVEVTNGVPIAVERALYNDANGVVWAAGTNATAVRLP